MQSIFCDLDGVSGSLKNTVCNFQRTARQHSGSNERVQIRTHMCAHSEFHGRATVVLSVKLPDSSTI